MPITRTRPRRPPCEHRLRPPGEDEQPRRLAGNVRKHPGDADQPADVVHALTDRIPLGLRWILEHHNAREAAGDQQLSEPLCVCRVVGVHGPRHHHHVRLARLEHVGKVRREHVGRVC